MKYEARPHRNNDCAVESIQTEKQYMNLPSFTGGKKTSCQMEEPLIPP